MGQPSVPAPEDLAVLGASLLAQGRAVEAVEVLRQAVAGGDPSAPDLLVRAYFDSGNWRAAADWLGLLVEQGHRRFAGRLGVALVQVGERDRAEAALRLALEAGEVTAVNDLAILLRDEGRLPEALRLLADAAATGDQLAAANLAELQLEAGDVAGAEAAAEAHVSERMPDTVLALADVRMQQGRHDDAERLYRRAAELRALRGRTAYGLFLLDVRGDVAGAERELREAERQAEPGSPYVLGRFLLDEGRGEEARPYLQAAVDEGEPGALEALAELDGVDPDEY
jgi:Flp pilus assembly protein TadD